MVRSFARSLPSLHTCFKYFMAEMLGYTVDVESAMTQNLSFSLLFYMACLTSEFGFIGSTCRIAGISKKLIKKKSGSI